MKNTLLLDSQAWDLVLDAGGNIAMASPPYSLAQDVASAVRLFLSELYYDSSKGVPYDNGILGELPPASVLCGWIEQAALTVSGVITARCIVQSFAGREVRGELQFIDETGAAHGLHF